MNDDLLCQYDRLPPHDIDAERCLLGSMYLDSTTIPVVKGIVGTRDALYTAQHQIIWDALIDMYDAGKPIDGVLLREELSRRQLLEEIGGTAELGSIIHATPTSAHAEHYARIVRTCYAGRMGIAACNDFLRGVYAPHKDPDAIAELARLAADRLSVCSVGAFDDDFVSIADVAHVVYEEVTGGVEQFVETGLREIDAVTGGVQIRGTTYVGGRPGTGKSQTARQIAVNVAARGRRAAIISVEETRQKIGANILAAYSGIKNSRIVFGKVAREDFGKLAKGCSKVHDLPLFINDKPVTLSEVVAAITLAATKYRAEVVVVDYLQLIDPEAGDNENREITMVSRALKAAFKRLNVAGVVAVQLNRGNEGAGGGSVRLPELRDLRGSGSLEQDGDLIVLLHREDLYHKGDTEWKQTNQLQAVIAKNKNGSTGVIPLAWDGDTQTVTDWVTPAF